jgi:8-oxo-dGTP pyrophosphatase MutT (NUDIX family)
MPASRASGRARKEVSSGGVVFRHTASGPEFALIKANGRWLFPKGNIEKGETLEAAALREISEETGLCLDQLRIARPLPSIEYAFRWEGRLVFKTVHNFLVELRGEGTLRPQLSEVEEAQWFSGPAARLALSFKNSQATLEAAIEAVDRWQVA